MMRARGLSAGLLSASVAGGFIAQQASLGVPFVLRGLILVVMFLAAFDRRIKAVVAMIPAINQWENFLRAMPREAFLGFLGMLNADRQTRENYPADSLMLDALFSPVIKVHYDVENSRVGQVTDYDRLILDVWTDGSVAPGDAIAYSAKILKDSLSIFITFEEEEVAAAEQPAAVGAPMTATPDNERLRELLGQPVDIIELSVRASNCLKAAKIRTIGDLVSRKDDELISYKNFGKKSLDEIKERLTELNLSLGMDVSGILQPAGKAS